MSVAQQWNAIGSNLPEGWQRASLRLELRDRKAADAAAAMLGPTSPYRSAPTVLLFPVALDGTAPSPDSIVRLLRRVPVGTLSLSGSQAAPQTTATARETHLTAAWDAAIASLPPDWSDLFAEIQLTSTDFVERAEAQAAGNPDATSSA